MKNLTESASKYITRTTGIISSAKVPLGVRLSVERDAVLDLLKQLSVDNEIYFHQISTTSIYNARLEECCNELSSSLDLMRDIIRRLQSASLKCDYDENTPGNGFRSLVCVNDIVLLNLISLLRICSENRGVIMFRIAHYCKEIEAYTAILRFLVLAYQQVISLLDVLDENSLFPSLEGDYQQYNLIFRGIESLDGSSFYGRRLGFQFAPSVTRIFRVIGLVLATYSLSWESGSAALSSIINSGKMLLNPEQRAKRIIKITREADIGFCRGFWNLSELPTPKLFCPLMAICEVSEIRPAGPIPLETLNGEKVLIHEPSAHTGVRGVVIKILSYAHRIGLSPVHVSNCLPPSPYLVIHCHGGGYVATSSKSHESYLRSWAKSLNCPIVSIDYSLAPENPFPRPTEEVLYAYAWILNHPDKFGWTGERVCMVGDSAGGNLIVSVSLKLIELQAKRLPDGLIPIYTPFLFQYLPSPSRVLSFMDPLLHMGVVIRCAAAYTGTYSDEELDKDCSFRIKHTGQPQGNGHRSLQDYVDEVQRAQRENILDFTQGSQSIVSLINLSFFNNKNFVNQSLNSSNISAKEQEISQMRQKDEKEHQDMEAMALANEEDEESEEVPENTIQSVHVESDPFHICLSSTTFDQCLIDYLQMHPITKSSIHNIHAKVDNNLNSSIPPVELAQEAVEEAAFNNLQSFKANSLSKLSSASINRSPLPSVQSFDGNLATPEPNDREDSLFYTPGSSIGRTPMYSKKRLVRNKGRSLSQSLADTAALAAGHALDNLSDWLDAPMEPLGYGDKRKLTRAKTMSPSKAARVQQEEAVNHHSHFTELLKLKLPRDYLMSPMYAPKEILAKLPPFRFVACHLDPLLDDTISFARRVRGSGGKVLSIDLLDNLPHGFLNFAPMSTDCREGSNICLKRIKEILQIL